jgi:predicted dehydrogenase
MNIVVVGNGAIGKERIKALETLNQNIVCIVDNKLAVTDYPYYSNLEDALLDIPFWIDWLFICTPHDVTCNVAKIAVDRAFNVLCEKPMGRTVDEYFKIMANKHNLKYNVGFNYRFFKGVNQLLQDCKEKVFGNLISVNMALALGDAPGSEKTWRLDPKQAGRGAILDPGIHLVDLMFQITNKPLKSHALHSLNAFWKTGIEEECHLIASDGETIFNIQTSKARWRNEFKIQVNGTNGYGIVEGRNRNYGNQTYRRGKKWGWQSGKSQRESEELVIDYDGEDSFLEETRAVLFGCEGIQPATAEDNLKCLKFIESL